MENVIGGLMKNAESLQPARASEYAPPAVQATVKNEKTVRRGRLYGVVTGHFHAAPTFTVQVLNEQGVVASIDLRLEDARAYANHIIAKLNEASAHEPAIDGLEDIFGGVRS